MMTKEDMRIKFEEERKKEKEEFERRKRDNFVYYLTNTIRSGGHDVPSRHFGSGKYYFGVKGDKGNFYDTGEEAWREYDKACKALHEKVFAEAINSVMFEAVGTPEKAVAAFEKAFRIYIEKAFGRDVN